MSARRILVVLVLVAAVVAIIVIVRACSRRAAEEEEKAPVEGALVLTSEAFQEGEMIPADYTCDGANVSPPLAWDNVPEGTVTLALIMDDPDAPIGTFTHWLICELPGRIRWISERVPTRAETVTPVRAVQGINGFNQVGYGGPCPPPGKPHRYYFKLYALDTTLEMPPSFSKRQLRAAMKGHILAEAQLMGRYGRQ